MLVLSEPATTQSNALFVLPSLGQELSLCCVRQFPHVAEHLHLSVLGMPAQTVVRAGCQGCRHHGSRQVRGIEAHIARRHPQAAPLRIYAQAQKERLPHPLRRAQSLQQVLLVLPLHGRVCNV